MGNISPRDLDLHPRPSSQAHDVPEPTTTGVPLQRNRKLSKKAKAMLGDTLPEGPGPLEEVITEPDAPLRIRIRRHFKTLFNSFGIRRTYFGRPSRIPDGDAEFADFLADNLRRPNVRRPSANTMRDEASIIAPYPNISSFLFNRWFWKRGQKTKESRRDLLNNVLFDDRFNSDDLKDLNFDRLDEEVARDLGNSSSGHSWVSDTVYIDISTGRKETKASRKADTARRRRHQGSDSEEDVTTASSDPPRASCRFAVHDFYHHKLVDIVTEVFSSADAQKFHFHPFEEQWQPPWQPESTERVQGEFFTSQAFLDADRELYNSPPEPDCELPRVIAAMMLYSDATHVAQFGQAKLWPGYTFVGNQSKYDRGRPSMRAGHMFAFFPSLPDHITDFICTEPDTKVTAALLAHCRRELFHACWKQLLDADFLRAYEHGIVIVCGDGVKRRVYPRIFTYSADYPEKVLVVSIRDMGQYPSPRCKVNKDNIPNLGTIEDMETRRNHRRRDDEDRHSRVLKARELIYEKGYIVNSERVDELLKDESLVPTLNAFSELLGKFGLNIFDLAVVDLLHELELGVWKVLLLHLIRILYTQGLAAVLEFNARFRRVASFGCSTIRRFPYNVADLKKLAARDFEDILQCCIPCFDGLFPEPHNQTIMDLLYIMAYFHSLSKLRMHTNSSLQELRNTTETLGAALRFFANETCRHFKTYETDGEYQARTRANARQAAKRAPNKTTTSTPLRTTATIDIRPSSSEVAASQPQPACKNVRKPAKQTTNHSDTATSIPPTLASATSVPLDTGRREKFFSLRTSKLNALGDYADQIEKFGTLDSLSTILGESNHRVVKAFNSCTNRNNALLQIVSQDTREAAHARMSHELATLEPIPEVEDPSVPLPSDDQLREMGSFSRKELATVMIQHNQIYAHARAAFNFTSYDIRCEQDTINVHTQRRDVMVPSFEDDEDGNPHPYCVRQRPEQFNFLWVQWFGRDIEWKGGPSTLRLDSIGFLPADDQDAFGFLDPSLVIRACYLIPAFSLGRTIELLGPSFAWEDDGDWQNYYVMHFVDCDMMMHFLGLGVGHCHPAGFPRENALLKKVPLGPSYRHSFQTACADSQQGEDLLRDVEAEDETLFRDYGDDIFDEEDFDEEAYEL
ncbi:hypothetical protein H0H81_002284 [Sphagnurus paluster]|uniref:Uncharacterized protein n=1 Tax=Sphagnurus paluster TaxID=117069 RepID=A0A9P7FM67_9AGAR|nr:hypothetical protein H0H81_002284 [Sphagnurus paluster]